VVLGFEDDDKRGLGDSRGLEYSTVSIDQWNFLMLINYEAGTGTGIAVNVINNDRFFDSFNGKTKDLILHLKR
jgi:hypothetical protein